MLNFAKNLKRYITNYVTWKRLLRKQKFRKDTWYFILSYGIGDAYIVSALMIEFIKLNGPTILIFDKPNQNFIPNLFGIKFTDFEYISIPNYLLEEFGSFKRGQPINLHPLKIYDAKFVSLVGLNGTTLADVYKVLLGLNVTCLLQKPVFPDFKDDFVENLFVENNLEVGKTVILCPQATSIALLNSNFWIDLADKINEFKFKVVLMNSPQICSSYRTINFPLNYSKYICDKAGYMISLRSGFCDLIATSSSKKIILYPDTEYYSGKLIDSTSLYKMGLSSKENLLEIVINKENQNHEMIQTILNFINE